MDFVFTSFPLQLHTSHFPLTSMNPSTRRIQVSEGKRKGGACNCMEWELRGEGDRENGFDTWRSGAQNLCLESLTHFERGPISCGPKPVYQMQGKDFIRNSGEKRSKQNLEVFEARFREKLI